MIPIPPNKNGAYKIIKFCRLCKTKFIVVKGESGKNYCDDCLKKFKKEQKDL